MALDLRELNLSTANACNADCIYCPKGLAPVPEKKFMPLSLVEKIMSEITTPEFKAQHNIVHSVLSENGECFLNSDILDIMRAVRAAGLSISVFTNFACLNSKLAWAIIRENLVDAIHFNLDGATQETYYAAKRLSLHVVEGNLRGFIATRNDLGSRRIRLFGHVIPAQAYTASVMVNFGVMPVKHDRLITPVTDGEEVIKKWLPELDPVLDSIGLDPVMFWAERYNNTPKKGVFACPNLERVKHVAYINPAGDWYGCCFDAGNDLILGNVYDNSLAEIADGPVRRDLVEKLEARHFEAVGWPCIRVDACQGMQWA